MGYIFSKRVKGSQRKLLFDKFKKIKFVIVLDLFVSKIKY